MLGRAIDQNRVVRAALRKARLRIRMNGRHPLTFRDGRQLGRAVDRSHIKAHGGQDGSSISGSRADYQGTLAWLQRHGRKKQPQSCRWRQGPSFSHWHRAIQIRQRTAVFRDESLALDRSHGLDHERIVDALGAKLAIDHCLSSRRIIWNRKLNRHNCSMLLIHLKCKVALIGRQRRRQAQPIVIGRI